MTYSYDHRKASDDDKAEKAAEHLENLSGMCDDVATEAEGLYNELDRSTDSDALRQPCKIAKDILDNLRTAESVEKLSDLVACVKDVQADVPKLEAALKEAKREAKAWEDEVDQVALDAIEEAVGFLRGIKRELKPLLREMADGDE